MKLKKILAAVAATTIAVSTMAISAFAEDEIPSVASAQIYAQNQGGDWAWFSDEVDGVKGPGSVIFAEPGTTTLTWTLSGIAFYTPVETWENYPTVGVKVSSSFIKAAGDTAKLEYTIGDVTITYGDSKTLVIKGVTENLDLLGAKEDWGISGDGKELLLNDDIYAELGITEPNAAYIDFLKSIKTISTTVTVIESKSGTATDDSTPDVSTPDDSTTDDSTTDDVVVSTPDVSTTDTTENAATGDVAVVAMAAVAMLAAAGIVASKKSK